ncbi:MAG: hypothetical protein KJ709_00575 [Nanoarchaeota archaeon]|nr:hypothetical protein [Nanoarchaeota archaeon]
MSKIYIDKSGQGKINIPREIMRLKGWNESTDIMIIPLLPEAHSRIDKEVPIIITEKRGE